jgi:hypothetical protein
LFAAKPQNKKPEARNRESGDAAKPLCRETATELSILDLDLRIALF